jgi:murein DD-endopeptidase MepM/ murein hydrolase activator NlpD
MRLPWILLPVLLAFPLGARAQPLVWPTPNPAFVEGKDSSAWVQPTSSGREASGLYGCVRNGGNRFHEAIDIATLERDARNRASDPVFAAMPGTVTHINRVAGHSSYGIYVVLTHEQGGLRFYTLYSHLARIAPGLEEGQRVREGEELGTLGTTAGGYRIPNDRAHLHFEVGLALNEHFQRWFDRQPFGSRNRHGTANGLNLRGIDPLRFYESVRDRESRGFADFLGQEEPAFLVRVAQPRTPDLLRRSPALQRGPALDSPAGWEIGFTRYGVPLSFRALAPDQLGDATPGQPNVLVPSTLDPRVPCRDLVQRQGDTWLPGDDLLSTLDLLFTR